MIAYHATPTSQQNVGHMARLVRNRICDSGGQSPMTAFR